MRNARRWLPAPEQPEDIDYRVPNVINVDADGKVVPVNYELPTEADESDAPSADAQCSDGVF